MKVYYASPDDNPSFFPSFIASVDKKLQKKLLSLCALLQTQPLPREPVVKHFTIARYGRLYELRARSRIMVRIIFALTDGGDILLLVPFVKSHKRSTMQALEASLKLLTRLDNGTCSAQEMLYKPN